ncbi:hypothetical protein J7E50_05040 [Pedobacter sp. ISL-68]|uniref:hypothetical protein n=1 Tax=unclassified Pedobacter TaxID=2628915 RepID=UPI001BEA9DF4|nr:MULTISPECIES: hypothetical protein [unclassified Pedobacter]MBT2563682.1 hypothetical protein [Pedobacter sp. ISL-64]MBT2589574.1 hypothetical protein [Pedobacter sp. ISL-68]
MKNLIALACVLLAVCTSGLAQELKTSKSLETALEQSFLSKKPVLLIINVTGISKPVNLPANVKVNFKSALEEPEVVNKIDENFIVYKTTMTDTNIRSIIREANIKSFPAFVFLRSNKDVFFKDFGNSTDQKKYISMINNALLASKEESISDMETKYNADKSNNVLLKKLIDTRKKLGITNNAQLIEQYANNLKIGDFNDYQNVLYILEAGPYSDGSAYKLAYTNRKIIDSLYRTELPQKRSAINNVIISNTIADAAKNKNTARAISAASFARNTWTKDYRRGDKAYNTQILWYYNTVKDTASYLRTASYFYDNFYMNVSADSIKKIEAKDREALTQKHIAFSPYKQTISKEKLDSLQKTAGAKVITQSFVSVGSPSNSYANELNNAAWKFYEIGTKNLNYLSKAMIWSRRSIELNPIPGYYDTLAHILYRLGYNEEAIKTQEMAIDKAKSEKTSTANLESELKKIKTKTL